jgi:hypothetical protein
MTLLNTVKDVCSVVGVLLPTSVFNNTIDKRTMSEMVTLANEMAQRIAYDSRDWTFLRKVATFTGDAVALPPDYLVTGTTAFDLPADYKRMLLTSNLWRSTYSQAPMRFVADTDEWLRRRARSATDGHGEWTNLGGQVHIFPPLGASETAFFSYLSKNCVALASGGYGDVFVSDGDSFALDERLLKLGMIWQWKAQKGSPYAEDLGTYEDALNSSTARDSPAPIIIDRPYVDSWEYASHGYGW